MIISLKKYGSVLTLFLLLVFPASPFQLFMPDDPEVEGLLSLYVQAGFVFPDASYPLSLADLDGYAARLMDRLSDDLRADSRENSAPRSVELLDRIEDYRDSLDYRKGRAVRGSRTSIRPAGFINGDVFLPEPASAGTDGGFEGDPVAPTRYPNDFYNRFVEFPDMAQLALFAGAQGESGLHISAGVKQRYSGSDVPEFNLWTGTEKSPFRIENYLIRTGYLAWRSDRFEAWLGRAPVHFGDARFSTFFPGERLPWLDAFTYRYQLGPLTMTSYFGTLDNRMTVDEERIFLNEGFEVEEDGMRVGFTDSVITDPATDYAGRENILTLDGSPTGYAFEETIILNSMHRFVLGWEKVRLGVTAAMITARENNALVIGDIFPVFSWHNAVVGHHNMHMGVDLGYAVCPGLGFYGQAAWDDVNASDVFGIPDSSIPTIGAYLAGFVYQPEWWDRTEKGADGGFLPDLILKAEIGRTHYLWGNYYAYEEEKGAYLSRSVYRYKGQRGYFWMPLTSPYGPGTWWVEGEGTLDLRPDLRFTTGFTYLRYNPEVNLFTTPYVRDDDLEDAEYSTSFSLYLETLYTWKLNEAKDLRFRLVPVWYSLKGHMWPELEISVEVLRKKLKDF